MTSQDHDHQGGATYKLHGRPGRTFDTARTALLVIDPVNDFLSPDGAAWELTEDTYVPLDAVVKVSEGKAFVNIPKLVVGKMPWDEPPSAEAHRAKLGPAPTTVEKLYGSLAPTG